MKYYKIVLLLLLVAKSSAHAQAPDQFLVDSLTNTVKQTLPFDRPFFLNFRGANAKSIYTGAILEWKIKNGKRKVKTKNDGTLDLVNIDTSDVYPRANGVDVYIQAQPSDKNFAILLAHHFDGDLLDEVMSVNLLLKNGKKNTADSILRGLDEKVEDKIKPYLDVPEEELKRVTFFGFDWDTDDDVVTGYKCFYSNKLEKHYQELDKLKSSAPDFISLENLAIITQKADAAKLASAELNTITSLSSRNGLSHILGGLVSLQKDFISSTTDLSKLEVRLKNLNTSLQATEKLIQLSERLQVRNNDPVISDFIAALKTFQADLKINRDLLKSILKKVKDEIDKEINLTYSTWAFGQNELWDLKTRGSYQIIPDIGVVGIVGIGNNQNELLVRPYLGASIYRRPVDKSVPYKYFEKRYRFWHRFSINIGLTTGKLEQGEFSDLYNNLTLLLGGNYKITRALSLSLGGAFMRRQNVNPAIDDKTTTFNPYFGLSFDLDFANAIQKLTGKLF